MDSGQNKVTKNFGGHGLELSILETFNLQKYLPFENMVLTAPTFV